MNEKTDKYLSTLDRSPRTIDTYEWALRYYFNVVGDELNDKNYEEFLESIKNLSPSSKRVLRSAVMGMYEFYEAGSMEKRQRLNSHYTKRVKVKPVNFDREAVEKIIAYCEKMPKKTLADWRDVAFVLMLADSGFRISELCSLDRNDVDWLNERVAITGKGEKAALVRLSKRSMSALMDYFTARDNYPWKSDIREPMFAQHGNVGKLKKMTSDGMRKAIKERMRQAGENVRIHDFRHYFVTIALISSNNLKIAQELARHESTVTTQRYAHFSENELDKTYNDIFNKR